MPLPARLFRFTCVIEKSPAPDRARILNRRAPQQWWLWPHLLGLDAPLVAVTWQWWWADTRGVQLPLSRHIILGLSVWLIYLADHLADASRAIPGEQLMERHTFCVRHRTPMRCLLGVIAAALVLTTPMILPRREFLAGLSLLGVAAVYFWLIHFARFRVRPHLPKEAVVGGMFALGSALFVGCLWSPALGSFLAGTVLFGALCALNCALISAWEKSPQDLADPASMLNCFPRLTAHLDRGAIFLMSCALCPALWDRSGSLWPVVLSAFGLWALNRYRTRLSLQGLRVLADVVLLTPLLALCWKAATRW